MTAYHPVAGNPLFRRPPYHHLLDWPAEDIAVGPVVGSATAIAVADLIQ